METPQMRKTILNKGVIEVSDIKGWDAQIKQEKTQNLYEITTNMSAFFIKSPTQSYIIATCYEYISIEQYRVT